jgi:hypothetical protein
MSIILKTIIIEIAFGNTLDISRFHLKTEVCWKRFGFKHQLIFSSDITSIYLYIYFFQAIE